mgnify:CR=1 FL=1
MNIETNKITNRFYLIVLGLFVFACILVSKLFIIQVSEGDYYRDLAQQRTVKNFILQPSRGNIYSDNESLLATTVPRYEIRWDAKIPSDKLFQKYKDSLSKGLGVLFEKPTSFYLKKFEKARAKKSRYILIGRNLNFSTYKKIKSLPLFNMSSLRGGLIVETQLTRENPIGKIAERTIGYEQKDPNGNYLRVGLEGAFGQYLKGENGRRMKQKIANGQWKPINDNNEKEPTEGYDVYTTLNINMQDIAHHSLLNQLEKFEADHGSVVVMETKTGNIKAISNLGRTSEGKYYEKLNYAIGEAHEPGSTFKLMAMIAALEDKVISVDDLVDTSGGELTFYNKYKVRDSKKGGYGLLTASKVFEVSSNTGIVKIIYDNYKNNPSKFVNRLYNMGLNKPLGLPFKGEAFPKIPYPTDSDWDGLDLPWMAFGYGVLMTPLQTLTFYNAIANGGEMVKPKFIDRISNFGEQPVKYFDKKVINPSICSKETLEQVQKMMFNVVDKKWGTAHVIKDENFSIAGKTGTCQVDYTEEETQYVSSFVGYFPAEAPQYSCIVVIHRPNKKIGYYGATVAAPVFKEIALNIFNTTPRKVYVPELNLASSDFDINSFNKSSANKLIPNVKGMPAMDALMILERMGLKVKLKGTGKVMQQSIKHGSIIIFNQKILLELS